jgi:hypothetical protein
MKDHVLLVNQNFICRVCDMNGWNTSMKLPQHGVGIKEGGRKSVCLSSQLEVPRFGPSCFIRATPLSGP